MVLFTTLFIAILQLHTTLTAAATGSVLQYGTPESVSLLPGPFVELEANITAYLTPRNYGSASFNKVAPLYPGATVIVGHQNTIVSHFAVGDAVRYADVKGTLLPVEERIATKNDTIYDMASLTKMFTTIAVLQQLDRGTIQLDGKVATYLPGFAVNGKENITILMLLTHTSGFDADPVPDLTNGYATYEERRQAIIDQALLHVPGKNYLYSDLSFMTLQLVLEAVTSTPLDVLIRDQFTAPLGMRDTFFNRGNVPLAPGLLARVASTEFQIAVLGPKEPQRPQPVWGNVHDENAWSLNGVAGHAGMFSTAGDLAIFCQMILNNGTYGGVRILEPSTVDMIFHDFNTAFPGNAHGLGFELNQFFWSGAMQSLQTAGHTGFTGTSMVIDRPSNTFFVLLNHRVHPSRNWSNVNVVREMLGLFVARALGRKV